MKTSQGLSPGVAVLRPYEKRARRTLQLHGRPDCSACGERADATRRADILEVETSVAVVSGKQLSIYLD